MEVYIAPGMDAGSIAQILAIPEAFVSLCKITKEDSQIGFLEPTHAQRQVIHALEEHKWCFVTKYRQAKITTITLMHLLLRDCMYIPGIEGMLIADTYDTAEMAFTRLRYAYQNLPDPLKVPLEGGSSGSKKQLRFVHGGGLSIHTLEGRAPAVGRSIDRLHITELGEALHQQRAIINLFPGINKRPNAKLVIESTPGRAGTYHEQMWLKALEGQGRFHPLFLEWWTDDSCHIKAPKGFTPTEDELKFMRSHRGCTLGHISFRRDRLNSEFVGDERLLSSKYPSSPYDGWIGSTRPRIPEAPLLDLLKRSQKDPEADEHGVGVFEVPVEGETYEVIADPTGFGADGDPAALSVFNMRTGDEVAVWSGPEDPDVFAVRVEQVCSYYNNARAVVEANHAGCITALKSLKVRITYSKQHPGWWASAQRVAKAEFALVRLLRAGEINIRSQAGIQQLRRYDGSFKRRETGDDGSTHHFDRARVYVMAAERLEKSLKKFARQAAGEEEDPGETWEPGTVPASRLFGKRDTMQQGPISGWSLPLMR